MILSAKIVIDKEYTGKSKHQFFHKLKKGDTILLSTELKTISRNVRGFGLEPTYIIFENLRNGEQFTTTMGLTTKYLNILEYTIM